MNNYMWKILHVIIHFKDSRRILLNYFGDCGRRDSNSHEGCSLEPKSSASTNFATSALEFVMLLMILKTQQNYK